MKNERKKNVMKKETKKQKKEEREKETKIVYFKNLILKFTFYFETRSSLVYQRGLIFQLILVGPGHSGISVCQMPFPATNNLIQN